MREFIFDGMGTGKTKRALDLMPHDKLTLIICPASVITTTWVPQIQQWANDTHISIVTGKTYNIPNGTHYIVCSYNQANKLPPKLSGFNLIVDESHFVKAVRSQRHKAVAVLSRHATNVLMLTGTPTPRNLEDMYGQTAVLFPARAERVKQLGPDFSSLTQFRRSFGTPKIIHLGAQTVTKWEYRQQSSTQVAERVSHYVRTLRKLNMTQPEPQWVGVSKSTQEQAALKKWETEWQLTDDVFADTASAQANKFSQLDDGFAYKNEQHGETYVFGKSKLEAIQQVTDSESPLLVWIRFKAMADMIQTQYGDQAVGLRTLIHDGRMSEITQYRVVYANPASSGTGVDGIQNYVFRQLWADLPWTAADYEQANARLIRRGQSEQPEIYVLDTEWNQRVMRVIQGRAKLDEIIKQPLVKE